MILVAEREFGLGSEDWDALSMGDWRKGLVAGLIRQRAPVFRPRLSPKAGRVQGATKAWQRGREMS